MNKIREWITQNKVIAILRNIPVKSVLPYARTAYNGGIRMFEIALNSDDAYSEIALLSKELPDDAIIGAGTAINPGLAERALLSGAKFLLSPSANDALLRYASTQGIPLLPGVMTPSDVDLCLSYGYSTLKLFPASDLPLSYIKSLKGPFSQTDYVAVGGVTMGNLEGFFAAGFLGVGIGSNLIASKYVKDGLWEKATEELQSALDPILHKE